MQVERSRYPADQVAQLLGCLPLVPGQAVHAAHLTLDSEVLISHQVKWKNGRYKRKSQLGLCPEGQDNTDRMEFPTHLCCGFRYPKVGCNAGRQQVNIVAECSSSEGCHSMVTSATRCFFGAQAAGGIDRCSCNFKPDAKAFTHRAAL